MMATQSTMTTTTTATTAGVLPTTDSGPVPRRIGVADLRYALARGAEDFMAAPTQLLFLGVIYPVIGLVAARAASGGALLPLLYPLVAGLALVGPVAALGIYELSRRREQGLDVSWLNAFDVLRSPAIGSIAALGALLGLIFVAWLFSAQAIFHLTMGETRPAAASISDLAEQVLTTRAGWTLIVLGNAVGLLFAILVLCLTVVSFPLLLDRDGGVRAAVRCSFRAVRANPAAMALWGMIVLAALFLGSLPFFVGLAVVMPLLGHATWHLYRRVVPS